MAVKQETGVAVVLGANRGIGLQVRQPFRLLEPKHMCTASNSEQSKVVFSQLSW